MSVEPAFGQIKTVQGFRHMPPRGDEKARSMWRFKGASHNVRKRVTVAP